MSEIRNRYDNVREKIESAARRAGRLPASIRLVVVTKTHPVEVLREAIEAGIRDLGENYPDEAARKILEIGPVNHLTWHMIGHIQSRKAEIVSTNFDFIHSIDSLKLASRLDRFALEAGRKLPVLIECNVSGEISKFGFPAVEHHQWQKLDGVVEQIAEMQNLEIRGLMTMPPFELSADKTKPFFQKMRELQAYFEKNHPQCIWDELSMGTSTDFEVAVEEGATIVRVGTAIMGSRPGKLPSDDTLLQH